MTDYDEKELARLIKSACGPVKAPPEIKRELRECIVLEPVVATAGSAKVTNASIWDRPRLWVPIAAVVIAAVIGYGAWLSLSMTPPLS